MSGPFLYDRVRSTTTTTGTGTVTLGSAVTGYQAFSVVGNGNSTFYCIDDPVTGAWEVGIGTYTSSGTTLSRTTILASSNSGSAVSFAAGTKDVFIPAPADRLPNGVNASSTDDGSTFALTKAFALSGDISPTTLSTSQNDYNPTGLSTASVLRLTASANVTITGLAGGTDGRIITIYNATRPELNNAYTISFTHNDSGSSSGNKFRFDWLTWPLITGDAAFVLAPYESVVFQYDSTSAVWKCLTRYVDKYFKGYINGCNLTYLTGTTLTVSAGICRDSTNSFFMKTGGQTLSASSAADLITKALTGTGTISNGATTLTGTSTLFLTEFTTRTCTGTITGASTTITGTGTLFLSEFAVGDLIGTNAKGYSRITAIASDTSLTIVAAIPGGSPAGTTPVCIENATITIGTLAAAQVSTITSNTSLTVATAAGSAQTGVTMKAGDFASITGVGFFLYPFLTVGDGAGGLSSEIILSTQRTTPWMYSANYNLGFRRIGSLATWGGNIIRFTQYGVGNTKKYEHHMGNTGSPSSRILSAGASAAWIDILDNVYSPPTARWLLMDMAVAGGTAGQAMYLRCRNIPSNFTELDAALLCYANVNGAMYAECPCDGAQGMQWVGSTAAGVNYLSHAGYSEEV